LKWQLPDRFEVWAMSGKDYVKNTAMLAEGMPEKTGTYPSHWARY